MDTKEIINLFAILLGPILAIQIQKWIERRKDDNARKTDIFKTLMATRGTVLSPYHVEALNRIDLEFSNETKYQKVISAWKEYFDNLSKKTETKEETIVWNDRNVELLANLLFEMGRALGYNFDKALIKRNWYTPVGHGVIENENNLIRKGLLDVLNGNKSIPMSLLSIEQDENELNEQKQLREVMIKYYEKEIGKNKI